MLHIRWSNAVPLESDRMSVIFIFRCISTGNYENIVLLFRVTNATANSNLYQCCSGLCIDLLKYLSDKIGFEYDLFQVEDRKFGAYDKVLVLTLNHKILSLNQRQT